MNDVRFVIDVNVYISYILKDKLDELFRFAFECHFEIFISTDLLIELQSVLQREKFSKFLKKDPSSYVEAVLQFGNVTDPPFVKVESPDRNDNFLFMLAIHTNAVIVTGDKLFINWEDSPVKVIALASFKT